MTLCALDAQHTIAHMSRKSVKKRIHSCAMWSPAVVITHPSEKKKPEASPGGYTAVQSFSHDDLSYPKGATLVVILKRQAIVE